MDTLFTRLGGRLSELAPDLATGLVPMAALFDATAAPPAALIALLAMVLEAGLGRRVWFFAALPTPAAMLRATAGSLGRRLDREGRGRRTLVMRGLIVTMLVGGVAGVLATVIALAGGRLAYGWLLETVALASLVGQRASLAAARHVRQAALGGRGLARAYAAVSGRPPARRDDHGIQREAVEDLATGFALRVVAVLFWYLLLGLAGAFVYVAVLETVAALRRGPGPAKLIAAAPAALLEAVAFVPARLAGLIMALASLSVPTTNPWRAFRVLARESHGHSSRLAGWPLAATAGALGLSLAGPWQTATAAGKEPWIGQGGRARAEPADLRRAAWLFAVSCLVTAALVAATGMIAA